MTDTNSAALLGVRGPSAKQRRCAKATGAANTHKLPAISASDPYSVMSEHQVQKALFAAYRKRGIHGNSVMFAIPNGSARGDDPTTRKIRGKILKDEGVEAGAPDIIAILDGAFYLIEIKRADGKLSSEQKAYHKALMDAGATVIVCYGFLDAVRLLEDIGIIRRPVHGKVKENREAQEIQA